MPKQYCPYCWPNKRTSHFSSYFEYYIEKLLSPFFRIMENFPKLAKMGDLLFFEGLALFGAVKFIKNPDEKKLFNKSLIIFREAKNAVTECFNALRAADIF